MLRHVVDEQARLGVLVAAVCVKASQLHGDRRHLREDWHQSARREMFGNLKRRFQDDAVTFQRPICQNVSVI